MGNFIDKFLEKCLKKQIYVIVGPICEAHSKLAEENQKLTQENDELARALQRIKDDITDIRIQLDDQNSDLDEVAGRVDDMEGTWNDIETLGDRLGIDTMEDNLLGRMDKLEESINKLKKEVK